jgi:hypothetical protein
VKYSVILEVSISSYVYIYFYTCHLVILKGKASMILIIKRKGAKTGSNRDPVLAPIKLNAF